RAASSIGWRRRRRRRGAWPVPLELRGPAIRTRFLGGWWAGLSPKGSTGAAAACRDVSLQQDRVGRRDGGGATEKPSPAHVDDGEGGRPRGRGGGRGAAAAAQQPPQQHDDYGGGGSSAASA
ncbi:unnamed protein product, partial [Ectocarpus sp. 8 AP-2014]